MHFYIEATFRVKDNEVLDFPPGDQPPRWIVFYERKDGVVAEAEYKAIGTNEDTVRRGEWQRTLRAEYATMDDVVEYVSKLEEWSTIEKHLVALFKARQRFCERIEEEEEMRNLMRRTTGEADDELPF